MKIDGEIRIGDEPTSRGVARWPNSLMAAADQNPGVWVSRVFKAGGGNTSYYKQRGYEATARTNDDGTRTLFIRKPQTSKAES